MKKFNNILMIFLIYTITNLVYSIDSPKKVIIKELKQSEEKIKAKEGDFLHLHYRAWLFDKNKDAKEPCEAKGKLFDSTLDPPFRKNPGNENEQFIFQKGKNTVIKGFEIGTNNMNIGSKRCLVIPPRFAYGIRKIGEIIPANSTLIFEVELKKVIVKEDKENKREIEW